MPTDGADFGRMKACYGSAFTAVRMGVDDSRVAEIVIAGLERDIRRDGGAPAFNQAVDLLVLATQSLATLGSEHLLEGADRLRSGFAESPLTRFVASAVESIGLASLNEGKQLSKEEASGLLLSQIARSRCCDGMTGYITKNRTQSALDSAGIVNSVARHITHSEALQDLAQRMLNGSANGLPAKQPKGHAITYSADALYSEGIEGGTSHE